MTGMHAHTHRTQRMPISQENDGINNGKDTVDTANKKNESAQAGGGAGG